MKLQKMNNIEQYIYLVTVTRICVGDVAGPKKFKFMHTVIGRGDSLMSRGFVIGLGENIYYLAVENAYNIYYLWFIMFRFVPFGLHVILPRLIGIRSLELALLF